MEVSNETSDMQSNIAIDLNNAVDWHTIQRPSKLQLFMSTLYACILYHIIFLAFIPHLCTTKCNGIEIRYEM